MTVAIAKGASFVHGSHLETVGGMFHCSISDTTRRELAL